MASASVQTASTQTERFDVRNRWTNAVQFTSEITCAPDASFSVKLGLAVRWAVKSRAYLSGANLSDADLSRADLSDADLSRADLSRADLSDADLSRANLSDADLFLTLSTLAVGPLDAQHLVAKLRAGEVDGSTYGKPDTQCACLVGTLAQPRGVRGEALDHNSGRPAERWFMMINPGDKPGAVGADGKETGGGFAARMALEWTLDWCRCHGVDPDAAPELAVAA